MERKNEKLKKALEAVKNGTSVSKAAELYGVPKATLWRIWKQQQQQTETQQQQPQPEPMPATEPQPTETTPEAGKIEAPVSHETEPGLPVSHETFNGENELYQMISELQNQLALKDTELKNIKLENESLKQQLKKLQQSGCELKPLLKETGYACTDIIRLWKVFTYAYWRYFKAGTRARRRARYFAFVSVQLARRLAQKEKTETRKILETLRFSQNIEEFWLWEMEMNQMFRKHKKAVEKLDRQVMEKEKAQQKTVQRRA